MEIQSSVCKLRVIRQSIDSTQPYLVGSSAPSSSAATGVAVRLEQNVYIATCFHVVVNARRIEAVFDDHFGSLPLRLRCVGCNPDLDIALLRVADGSISQTKLNRTVAPLLMGDSDALVHGEEVSLFGFPLGIRSMTQGITTGRLGEPMRRLQISAPSSPGNSGGPVVAMQHNKHRIVGILTSSLVIAHAQNFNLASPIYEALLFMKRAIASSIQPLFERELSLNVRLSSADRHFIESIPKSTSGAVVAAINTTDADRAGFEPGDVIRRVRVAQKENAWIDIDAALNVTVPWCKFGPLHVKAALDRVERNSEGTSSRAVEFDIVRSKKRRSVSMNLSASNDVFRIVYPLFEPLEFVVRAGVVVQMMSRNLAEADEEVSFDNAYMLTSDFVFYSCIVITHVRPDSPFHILYRPNPDGFVYVTSVNERPVTCLAEYAKAWATEMKGSDMITLRTRDSQMFSAPVKTIKKYEAETKEVTSRAGRVSTVEHGAGGRLGQV